MLVVQTMIKMLPKPKIKAPNSPFEEARGKKVTRTEDQKLGDSRD